MRLLWVKKRGGCREGKRGDALFLAADKYADFALAGKSIGSRCADAPAAADKTPMP